MTVRLYHILNWPELAQKANKSVAALAKSCGVSLRTLERHFQKEIGKSPKNWLAEQRLLRANELIQGGSSVKEVATSLDYKHPGHFSRDFKEFWGHSPANKTVPIRAQNP
jgi:transcriptional regulator GlxA family with amidase domain